MTTRTIANRCLSLLATAFLFFGCIAHAEESAPAADSSRLLLSGFGSLGIVEASTNFGGTFARELSQVPGTTGMQLKPDSRLGVQANFSVSNQLEAVGQVVARDRSAKSKVVDSVELAFLAYRPNTDTTVRVGRVSADIYLLSDFKNTGFAYLSARPNVDFYGALSFNSFDGLDVRHTWQAGDADWSLKAGIGKAKYDLEGVLTPMKNTRLLVLSREKDGLTVRGTLGRGRISLPASLQADAAIQGLSALTQVPNATVASQAAGALAQLTLNKLNARYTALGLAYEKHNWLLNAELMRATTESKSLSGTAAYVLAGYRVGAFTPFVGLSRARSLSQAATDPNWGAALAPLAPFIGATAVAQAQALGTAVTNANNARRVDQKTITLGLRWDATEQMSLKAQWDIVRVAPSGGAIWGGDAGGGKAHVGSVVLDFVF